MYAGYKGGTGQALLCWEDGGSMWKELISCSLQSTGEHAQSHAIWEFALLAQLLTIYFCAPGWLSGAGFHWGCYQRKVRVFGACLVCPAEWRRLQLSLLQEMCNVSPLFVLPCLSHEWDAEFAPECVCKVHGSKEKLEAEVLLKAHGKKGVSAAAKVLTVASDKGKDCLLIC